MRNAIINRIKRIQEEYGYQEVTIPHITKPDLYKKIWSLGKVWRRALQGPRERIRICHEAHELPTPYADLRE